MQLRCIRHGESASNAGLPTDDHMTIPLSDLGWRQAEEIASSIVEAPDLIVCSPMLRTQQTAEATMRKFPGVPVRVLEIGEFTCLSPVQCRGTTRDERTAWREAYWSAADPKLVHGESAESFSSFWRRVRGARDDLEGLAGEGYCNVVLFGHGQFLQALRWLMLSAAVASPETIKQFHVLNNGNAIFNARGFSVEFDGEWRITVDNGDYLPISLRLFSDCGLCLEETARLTARTRMEFLIECRKRGITIVDYTAEELEEELRILREMTGS